MGVHSTERSVSMIENMLLMYVDGLGKWQWRHCREPGEYAVVGEKTVGNIDYMIVVGLDEYLHISHAIIAGVREIFLDELELIHADERLAGRVHGFASPYVAGEKYYRG